MLPQILSGQLSIAASPVIAKVLANGGARSPKPSGEVSAVRTMTLDGFDEIASAWAPILGAHGYRIDLHSVFCHSRPQVTFAPIPHPNYPNGKNPRRCELADLLIVMDHVDDTEKIVDRRAVLVQAKMLKGGALKPTSSEWVQHELLAWLPVFTFVDSGYNSRSRNLKQQPLVGSPAHTAEYGGIDLNSAPPTWRHELTETTSHWFSSPISLSDYLAGMATGDPSCSREAVRGGVDDWSFTVDELLQVTASLPITKTNAVSRGNSNVICFIADTSSLMPSGGGGKDYFDTDTPEWPEGPISTVHLTLTSIEGAAKR